MKKRDKKSSTLGDQFKKLTNHPVLEINQSLGQKSADKLAKWAGSWAFIFTFFVIVIVWILTNLYAWTQQWDPYPFILLNLALSLLAAIQAPVILMSQNRESQKDRIRAEYDYAVNRRAEREIADLKKQLNRIERKI